MLVRGSLYDVSHAELFDLVTTRATLCNPFTLWELRIFEKLVANGRKQRTYRGSYVRPWLLPWDNLDLRSTHYSSSQYLFLVGAGRAF